MIEPVHRSGSCWLWRYNYTADEALSQACGLIPAEFGYNNIKSQ